MTSRFKASSFDSYKGDIDLEGSTLVEDRVKEGIGHIILKRPQALNALSVPMMVRLLDLITQWETDDNVHVAVIRGTGARAFCSGGDLKGVYEAYHQQDFAFLDFLFRTEYTFNARLKAFSKPYLALMHGIVMGGGVGASIHGSHRLVTDDTLFAMPETGIGYFPDVGGTYFLNQCPPEIGLYVGLTGNRLQAGDLLYAGFATHYAPQKNFDALCATLHETSVSSPQDLESLLSRLTTSPPPSPLKSHQDLLKRCFLHNTLEEVFTSLSQETSPFAQETLRTLSSRSPLSLHITFKQITEGRGLSFEEAMKREFALSQNLLHRPSDFIEGIRAAVIDKDRQPQWKDFSFSEGLLSSYFRLPDTTLALEL